MSEWEEATLGELCSKVQKSDPVSLGRDRVRYIDIGCVDGSLHRLTDVPEIGAANAPSRCRQVVASGDTVFSTVRPYLEKIAFVDESLNGEFASTGFSVLRPGPRLDPKFLYFFTISQGMFDQILPLQKGVSYPAVLDKEVRAVSMPVPPLDEQRRVVAILEDHFSHLDAADANLRRTLRRLEDLRALVLADAYSGETQPLRNLAIDADYGTSTKCVVEGPGPAVVRIPNLTEGTIDLTEEKRVASDNVDVSKSMLSEGDLLIVRTNGSVDLIGRSAVVGAGVEAAFASYLIRYRLKRDAVRPQWVQSMLSTPQLRSTLESLAASSAGQHNLSLSKLGPIQIPVPSIEAQDQILERVNALDQNRRRLEKEILSAQTRSAALRRSLLAAAFSGRLTGVSEGMSEAREMVRA